MMFSFSSLTAIDDGVARGCADREIATLEDAIDG